MFLQSETSLQLICITSSSYEEHCQCLHSVQLSGLSGIYQSRPRGSMTADRPVAKRTLREETIGKYPGKKTFALCLI